jgi:hypothetical protein
MCNGVRQSTPDSMLHNPGVQPLQAKPRGMRLVKSRTHLFVSDAGIIPPIRGLSPDCLARSIQAGELKKLNRSSSRREASWDEIFVYLPSVLPCQEEGLSWIRVVTILSIISWWSGQLCGLEEYQVPKEKVRDSWSLKYSNWLSLSEKRSYRSEIMR